MSYIGKKFSFYQDVPVETFCFKRPNEEEGNNKGFLFVKLIKSTKKPINICVTFLLTKKIINKKKTNWCDTPSTSTLGK